MEGWMSSARSMYIPLRICRRMEPGTGEGRAVTDAGAVAGVAVARVKDDAGGGAEVKLKGVEFGRAEEGTACVLWEYRLDSRENSWAGSGRDEDWGGSNG